jgi:UDP-N-acetylglucosamine 2-epimerase
MKILTVIGARPQFIKAAVVSRLLKATPGVEEVLVHTGQHYDESMSDVFFQELEIPKPAFHLGVGGGGHGAMTGRMLEALEKVMLEVKPDKVMSTATPTPRSPALLRPPSCTSRSRMSKRGCVRSTAACRRRSTA